MTRAFVSLGSNIEPEANTLQAVRLLDRETRVISISTVYLTEAEGCAGQPPYYNCVVEIETELPPAELKHRVFRRIEAALGRVRSENKYDARTIDLDLILYDELVVTSGDLTLPDPDILRRPFIAIPLQELATGLTLPRYGLRIDDIAATLMGSSMKPLTRFTEKVRKDILHGRRQGTHPETDKGAAS